MFMAVKNVCVCPVQLSRARETELREEVVSLRQENKELQYNIGLLEEDNQILRGEIQHLTGKTLGKLCFLFLILQMDNVKPSFFWG